MRSKSSLTGKSRSSMQRKVDLQYSENIESLEEDMIALPTHGNQKRTSSVHRRRLRNIGRQDYRPKFRLLWHFDAHEPALNTCIVPMTSSIVEHSSELIISEMLWTNQYSWDANLLARSPAFPRGG